METEFTPMLSLAGGMLIGVASVLMMAFNGRIAGISGIISRMLPPEPEKTYLPQGVTFVIGMLLPAPVYQIFTGNLPVQTMVGSPVILGIAGILVGFGSVLGSGCTSGHGVCGLSRLSVRSLVATATFMGTAFLTVLVLRHVVGG